MAQQQAGAPAPAVYYEVDFTVDPVDPGLSGNAVISDAVRAIIDALANDWDHYFRGMGPRRLADLLWRIITPPPPAPGSAPPTIPSLLTRARFMGICVGAAGLQRRVIEEKATSEAFAGVSELIGAYFMVKLTINFGAISMLGHVICHLAADGDEAPRQVQQLRDKIKQRSINVPRSIWDATFTVAQPDQQQLDAQGGKKREQSSVWKERREKFPLDGVISQYVASRFMHFFEGVVTFSPATIALANLGIPP